MKYVRVSTASLWKFLSAVADGNGKILAFRSVLPDSFHDRSIHRWWHRFAHKKQSTIRSQLSTVAAAPSVASHNPTIQSIMHLQAAFPLTPCPIDTFQYTFQTSFL